MYCRTCATGVQAGLDVCPSCGSQPMLGQAYCQNCAEATQPGQQLCARCGFRLAGALPVAAQGGALMGTKTRGTAILLCVLPMFIGLFGIHRFYTGHTLIGILQLLTGGGCGVWQIIDLIMLATGSYRDSEGRQLLG